MKNCPHSKQLQNFFKLYDEISETLENLDVEFSRFFMKNCWKCCSIKTKNLFTARKFAPRCCVCKMPIMPEPGKEETVRVVALDRSFHPSCYKCEDCGLLLSSEAEGRGCYPLDDHVLCKSCNAKRVQALTSHMSTEL